MFSFEFILSLEILFFYLLGLTFFSIFFADTSYLLLVIYLELAFLIVVCGIALLAIYFESIYLVLFIALIIAISGGDSALAITFLVYFNRIGMELDFASILRFRYIEKLNNYKIYLNNNIILKALFLSYF